MGWLVICDCVLMMLFSILLLYFFLIFSFFIIYGSVLSLKGGIVTVVMVGVCVCLNSNISSEGTIGWFVIWDCVLMMLISILFLFG